MISLKNLKRCIDILATLHAKANNSVDKELILEISYIIQQEIEIATEWENSHAHKALNTEHLETDKLLKDNIQLAKENEKLYNDNCKLVKIIQTRIKDIGHAFHRVEGGVENLIHKINHL